MGLINWITNLLNTPFPAVENARVRWKIIAFHGLFVAFFLLSFRPFAIYRETGIPSDQRMVYTIGLVLTVVLTLIVSDILIWKLLKAPYGAKNWTIGKSGLLGTWDVLVMIFSVFLYINYWSDFQNFTYQALIRIGSITVAFALIPATITTIFLENWWLRQNMERANNMQNKVENAVFAPAKQETITLQSENNNEWLKITPNQLLYLESEDNYVSAFYKEQEQVKKHLLRSNLKKLETQLTEEAIVRCHRSYIVNLKNIKKVEGNSRGLQLYFHEYDREVPVSRRYVKQILAMLENYQK